MKRVQLWPAGLTGRVTLVLLAAIGALFLGTVMLFGEADRLLARNDQARRIAEQLVVAEKVIADTAVPSREAAARNVSTRHVRFELARGPRDGVMKTAETRGLHREFLSWQTELRGRDLQLRLEGNRISSEQRFLIGALRLRDGSWLRFRSTEPLAPRGIAGETLVTLAILTAAVLLVAAMLVRTLASPLRALADATDEIGFATRVDIDGSGSRELRRLAQALNAMQARISELLASRTAALAAVSHDLRTPLARIRLRLASLPPAPEREAIGEDLAEMEEMLGSLLDFLGGLASEEPSRVNVASLIQLAVEQAQDGGMRANYSGPDKLVASIHPSALKRAVVNVIDNASKYGGVAHVTLEQDGTDVRIVVTDEGEGMIDTDLARALEPFFRADIARARDTKGFGLGLPIVDQVVRAQHHGKLLLETVPGQGLRVTMTVPVDGAVAG